MAKDRTKLSKLTGRKIGRVVEDESGRIEFLSPSGKLIFSVSSESKLFDHDGNWFDNDLMIGRNG